MSNNDQQLAQAVEAAQSGDLAGFAQLVELTESMAYAVALRVLHKEADARDAVQDAYLKAFRRLSELRHAAPFPGWLRRIVITTALNRRRRNRSAWLPLTESSPPPVLDEDEKRWTDAQQRLLARALLTLSTNERRLCELHYHGGWSAERLAREERVDAATLRKRLQRIRDKLREEIEMDEQRLLRTDTTPGELPLKIIELLARPRLVDLPENPVASVATLLRSAFPDYSSLELPEQLDLKLAVDHLGGDAVYIERSKLQSIDRDNVLRYDLTLPLLLNTRWQGLPQRLSAAGKVYRREVESSTHLEAFHQLELFAIDERAKLDAWAFAGRIFQAVDRVLPRAELRVTPTEYPMCARAWSLDILRDGEWVEVLAWGEYADWVLRGLGADPALQLALGAGVGLERLAALKYSIDDIRKMSVTSLT
ncbi:MAG TPA: sigma-70 family RNA polymerase sigma factor [Polyangiaceae bacterium]|nr:sigma-70 family RNA polymerase sigma factor [Polyangiaceae bacterium]